ncbi:MAG: glutathione-disulfide reductase [Timaviella obliquedivisa GSE-PSE-MK23-08B]|jgi:glutathione reductase (NADPH)|nr:glutathione-disulfide reductase [Timaviella obliquedivisa GSE-PSE-MK23-08B]
MSYDYDLFVIGAGPGGLAASKRAAQYGARVGIADLSELGGCCVNRGCIAKKLMVYAADFAHLTKTEVDYGWSQARVQFDWQRFVGLRDQEIQRLRQVHQRTLEDAGIDFIPQRATFADAHTLQVGDRSITANKILIAVGGKPIKPKISGIEHALTSNDMFDLKQLPSQIAIIGGGYIGVEFASILQALGTQVTLIDHDNAILSGFDDDVRLAVQNGLIQRGISVLCNTNVQSIEQISEGLRLMIEGDRFEPLTADVVLCATGRTPNLEGLQLEKAAIEINDKAIEVDDHSRTSQAHIFAIGDCTSRVQLTTLARSAGRAFADSEFGNQPCTVDYDLALSAVCSRPEAAAVGLSEAQAQAKYSEDQVKCYRSEFQPLFYSLSHCSEKTLMKLVVQRESDRLLGIHMVGENAAEIVQSLAITVQQGMTKAEFDKNIGIHPSTAEEFFSLN